MPTAERAWRPFAPYSSTSRSEAPVAHRRLLVKLRVAVDHHQQLHHAPHPVQVADDAFGGGKAVDGALAGRLIALLNAHLPPQLAAGDHRAVGTPGQVAGYEQQVAGAHRGNKIAQSRVGFGYFQAHCGQLAFNFHNDNRLLDAWAGMRWRDRSDGMGTDR